MNEQRTQNFIFKKIPLLDTEFIVYAYHPMFIWDQYQTTKNPSH